MAWFKDLAGKAEDFLNQIDQNAAVAFHSNDKKSYPKHETLIDLGNDNNLSSRIQMPTYDSNSFSPRSFEVSRSSSRSSVDHSLLSNKSTRKSDDELLSFLNVESNQQQKVKNDPPLNIMDKSTSRSSITDFEKRKIKAEIQKSSITDGSSTSSMEMEKKIDVEKSVDLVDDLEEIKAENKTLKNELYSINNEMSLLLQRAKAAESDCEELKHELSNLQSSYNDLLQTVGDKDGHLKNLEGDIKSITDREKSSQSLVSHLQKENERLNQLYENSKVLYNNVQKDLQDRLAEKSNQFETAHAMHIQEMSSLRDRISELEQGKTSLSNQVADFSRQLSQSQLNVEKWKSQIEWQKSETKEARLELDQYRTRAQRILQDKEKLISELHGKDAGQVSAINDETISIEMEQLQQERVLLREEVVQLSNRLQQAREQIATLEHQAESDRVQSEQTRSVLQESLLEERRAKEIAEEDCKLKAEELRSVRKELCHQRTVLASRVHDRESELSKLKNELTQRPSSPTDLELESRLHALTQTLVLKQTAVESLTIEKNALRLQLEKMEHSLKETLGKVQQNASSSLINVNDTDDAKARLPSFLVESPFDTGVALRVKRAYSSLDSLGIRTGVFLRRYPLARIFVLCYMIVLHLWVMLVLFSYTPETHQMAAPSGGGAS